jgi:hypothetical protein
MKGLTTKPVLGKEKRLTTKRTKGTKIMHSHGDTEALRNKGEVLVFHTFGICRTCAAMIFIFSVNSVPL